MRYEGKMMKSSQKIRATVFIPTWFGEKYLEEVLTMVFCQKVSFKFEVLIYDTSSQDGTVDIITRFANKHANLRWKTITKEEFSHGGTRNRAAHDALGEFVVYISQDATPADDRWLYEILKPFELNDRVAGVMGAQVPRTHCFPLLKREIHAVFGGFGPRFGTTFFYADTFVTDQGVYDAISFYSDVNSAARRSVLVGDIPYQDVAYAEDQLFGRDLIDGGYIKAFAPRAAVVHSNDMKLNEYKSRMFDETIGLRRVGVPVAVPSIMTISKMIIRGVLKDWAWILRDRDYSLKRKLFWVVANPLYHIEKWRGVRVASRVELSDSKTIKHYSLEAIKERNSKIT